MRRKLSRLMPAVKALVQAKRICARATGAFRSDRILLQTASTLFELRSCMDDEPDEAELHKTARIEKKLTRLLHARIAGSSDSVRLARVFQKRKLSRVEREIMLALALSATGIGDRVNDVDDVQRALGRRGIDGLAVVRALAPGSRLAKKGLVILEDDEEPVTNRVTASPEIVDLLVTGARSRESYWRVKNYDELLDRLLCIFSLLRENSQSLEDEETYDNRNATTKRNRKLRRLECVLHDTVERHPSWPIAEIVTHRFYTLHSRLVILLIGREMNFPGAADEQFKGEQLARAVSHSMSEVRSNLRLLTRDATLRSGGYVQVCGGAVGERLWRLCAATFPDARARAIRMLYSKPTASCFVSS